jgi:hypothetical protein
LTTENGLKDTGFVLVANIFRYKTELTDSTGSTDLYLVYNSLSEDGGYRDTFNCLDGKEPTVLRIEGSIQDVLRLRQEKDELEIPSLRVSVVPESSDQSEFVALGMKGRFSLGYKPIALFPRPSSDLELAWRGRACVCETIFD